MIENYNFLPYEIQFLWELLHRDFKKIVPAEPMLKLLLHSEFQRKILKIAVWVVVEQVDRSEPFAIVFILGSKDQIFEIFATCKKRIDL